MKEYISQWFNPFYEKHLCSKASEEPFDEVAEITDAIFHEREFIAWLKKEYSRKWKLESYPSLATEDNFLKYHAAYSKRKNSSAEKKKKERISAQLIKLRSEPLAAIISDEYDINITAAYRNLKDLISVPGFQKSPYVEEYLEAWRNSIKKYCVEKNLPYKKIMRLSYPVIVPSEIPEFEEFLARTLTTYDPNRIEAMLSFQNARWKGEELFASLLEYRVYARVKSYSPFDNSIRLEKIMNWVNKNRVFDYQVGDNEVLARKPRQEGNGNYSEPEFIYWPYTLEKLIELYIELQLERKIERNDSFVKSFNSKEDIVKIPTVWKTSMTELMYLFHLIYKKKKTYRSIPIHTIAYILFKRNKEKNFDSKNLCSALSDVLRYENEKKLSRDLLTIKDIFDSLNLS